MFDKKIIQFYLSDCVHEYIIGVSCVKEAVILNFCLDVSVSKFIHVDGCILMGFNSTYDESFCLYEVYIYIYIYI